MANGQSAADFIAKRRAQAGKTARRRTGGRRTGGGGTGGGTSKTPKRPPPSPELLRTAAAGLASADVVTGRAPRTETDFQDDFKESRTNLGLADVRRDEGTQLFDLLQARKAEMMDTRDALQKADAELQRSVAARRRMDSGVFTFGGASTDPDDLRESELYNRRFAAKNRLQQLFDQQASDVDMLQQAADSGQSVAEIKQQLMSELDSQDAERERVQEEIDLIGRQEGRSLTARLTPSPYRGVEKYDDEGNYQGISATNFEALSGPLAEQMDVLDAQKKRTLDFLNILPETEEFVPGVDPVNETAAPITTTPRRQSRPMTDDEFLGSMLTQSVTNPIDPILKDSVQDELRRGGGQPIAEATDTGR